MKCMYFIIAAIFTLNAQGVLPVTLEIMDDLQKSYQQGEIDSYIEIVLNNQNLSEDDSLTAVDEIERFFESDQFVKTGAQYLTSLFTERELHEMQTVLRDSSLRNDPNFKGAEKLDKMMNRLKPYLVKYLRHLTQN